MQNKNNVGPMWCHLNLFWFYHGSLMDPSMFFGPPLLGYRGNKNKLLLEFKQVNFQTSNIFTVREYFFVREQSREQTSKEEMGRDGEG